MVWPSGYSPLYRYPDAIPAWQWTAAALLLAAFCILAYRIRSRRPWLAAGWFWFLAVLLPASGMIPVGYQAWADRYAYLPSARPLRSPLLGRGQAVGAALAGPRRRRSRSRPAPACSVGQGITWRTGATANPSFAGHGPWTPATPGPGWPWVMSSGEADGHAEALAEFEAAARLDPLAEGLAGNLGYEYLRARHFQEALPWLIVAASAAPDNTGARSDVVAALVRAGWKKDRANEVLRFLGTDLQGDFPGAPLRYCPGRSARRRSFRSRPCA